MTRVFSYIGLLAVVVIIAILAVNTLKSVSTVKADSGEAKAVKQINADGDEKIDPKSEMKSTIRDALSH